MNNRFKYILTCILTASSIIVSFILYYIASQDALIGSMDGIFQKWNITGHVFSSLDRSKPEQVLTQCQLNHSTLGPVPVASQPLSWQNLSNIITNVRKGGRWRPLDCIANYSVAIVTPYRDRDAHLRMFVRHMHDFLQRQKLEYGIYVIEQDAISKFNRGMLMNIGYVEALKRYNYTCFVFSDVDLLPENSKNMYDCPVQPRHLSVAPNTHKYRLLYNRLFGGVENFSKDQFKKINGFSNKYFGWGGEDDDLYNRLKHNGYRLIRPPIDIAHYTMSGHEKTKHRNPNRMKLLRRPITKANTDGLNSLQYEIMKEVEYPLYTLVSVKLNETAVLAN